MKQLLTVLMLTPFLGMAQQKTYVPDDLFEHQLELNQNGVGCYASDGIVNNDSVLTSALEQCSQIYVYYSVTDLTGIKDMLALTNFQMYYNTSDFDTIDLTNSTNLHTITLNANKLEVLDVSGLNLSRLNVRNNNISELDLSSSFNLGTLDCGNNNLSDLDISHLSHLGYLACDSNNISVLDISSSNYINTLICNNNNITTLDISNQNKIEILNCSNNQITDLDFSNLGYKIKKVNCSGNQLTTLDFSTNTAIWSITASNNPLLYELNIKNTFNYIINPFIANNNPNLYCIQSDYVTWQTQNWTDIDNHTSFNQNCNYTTSVIELNEDKSLLKILDVLGAEVKPTSNTPLFYIYEGGAVEKKIIIN
jgi:Leucine-rich repeat (LRR) protein